MSVSGHESPLGDAADGLTYLDVFTDPGFAPASKPRRLQSIPRGPIGVSADQSELLVTLGKQKSRAIQTGELGTHSFESKQGECGRNNVQPTAVGEAGAD
ncbi:MAG TPA: hypothetical protein VES67_24730 [Vicinamibacterales bacterium]|nr:hypothetical protein [Vicinamibacterales bacterium]